MRRGAVAAPSQQNNDFTRESGIYQLYFRFPTVYVGIHDHLRSAHYAVKLRQR